MKPKEWSDILKPFLLSEKGIALKKFVEEQRSIATVYPDKKDMLRIFQEAEFPYGNVKLVIVGQDPYYNGTADGLAFSSRSTTTPDSLRNIFKELKSNLYSYMSEQSWKLFMPSNSLENWAKQGVLLMNTVLTVEKDKPNSHKGKGWEDLTSSVIEHLGKEERPIVFMLWGNNAKGLKPLITGKNHLILESVHPSPLSADKGFIGCKHFETMNNFFIDSKYYEKSLNKVSLDLRPFVDIQGILTSIKEAVSKNTIPLDNPNQRIIETHKLLERELLWDILYMFNFTTKS